MWYVLQYSDNQNDYHYSITITINVILSLTDTGCLVWKWNVEGRSSKLEGR